MSPGLSVVALLVGAGAAVAFMWWLERVTRVVGLGSIVTAIGLLSASVLGFVNGARLLPALMLVSAVGSLSHARWLRSVRTTVAVSHDADRA